MVYCFDWIFSDRSHAKIGSFLPSNKSRTVLVIILPSPRVESVNILPSTGIKSNVPMDGVVIVDDDGPAPSQSNKLQGKRKSVKEIIMISSDEEDNPTRKKNKKIYELEGTVKTLVQVSEPTRI